MDLSANLILNQAKGPRGEKGFDTSMYEDLDFRVLTGKQQPEDSRISEFRRSNLDDLNGLFIQILRLCQNADMVSLGYVSLVDAGFRKAIGT